MSAEWPGSEISLAAAVRRILVPPPSKTAVKFD